MPPGGANVELLLQRHELFWIFTLQTLSARGMNDEALFNVMLYIILLILFSFSFFFLLLSSMIVVMISNDVDNVVMSGIIMYYLLD